MNNNFSIFLIKKYQNSNIIKLEILPEHNQKNYTDKIITTKNLKKIYF